MKVAFVVQRYSTRIGGGSEQHCRQIVERLSPSVDIEVLTSCALDYVTWKNELKPGLGEENGVRVRRFPVDFPRTPALFDRISGAVFDSKRSPLLEETWVREQGPYSSEFIRYLRAEADRYDVFVFFTYLYGFTYYGLPQVGHKSILVPTAHDEPPIYLDAYRKVFESPRALLFNTPEEKDFVVNRFSLDKPNDIVALGISLEHVGDAKRFFERHPDLAEQPYLLYLGRMDESKGCGQLFDYFIRYKAENPSPLKLVLIGQAVMPIPDHPDIRFLGFVEEQEKYDALAACRALVMPSPYESLSMVLLEAWAQYRPVMANANCLVLKGQCERSQGGLVYSDFAEFQKALSALVSDARLCDTLGHRGRAFVEAGYQWDHVLNIYRQYLERVSQGSI